MRYSTIIVRWPGFVIFTVSLLSLFAMVVVVFYTRYLDFTNHEEGIYSRKTDISSKIHSLRLLNTTEMLSPIPSVPWLNTDTETQDSTMKTVVASDVKCAPSHWKNLFKVMIEPTESGATLLDMPHIKSLCKLGDRITSYRHVNKTCGMISFLDVIRNVTGATCESISENDINVLHDVMSTCSQYFFTGVLNSRKCESSICSAIPSECFNAYDLFYFFADDSFYKDDSSKLLKRTIVMFALEDTKRSMAGNFFVDNFALSHHSMSEGVVKIIGIDITFTEKALNFYLIFDFVFMGTAFLLIGVIMIFYLRSLVMTLVAAIDVGLSLVLAYFIYAAVFQIKLFPFLNLLAGLILIALVADDVFLFVDTMDTMKERYPTASMEEYMRLTFRHAGMSIFVTSFTTTASFFANMVSDVPAARCFGLYSGLCVACNFLLMCTFIPACLVLVEKSKLKKMKKVTYNPHRGCINLAPLHKRMAIISDYIFQVAIPKMINTLYPVFIILLLGVGVASGVCVFYKPKFSLPSDSVYQALVPWHPISIFGEKISDYRFYQAEQTKIMMPVIYVWGVDPKDTGSMYDAKDKGEFFLNEEFNLTVYDNQVWMSNICETLKKNHTASRNHVCSMTEYLATVGKCGLKRHPCCCNKETAECFTKCFPVFMAQLYSNKSQEEIIGIPYFTKDNNVKAFVMQFISNYVFEQGYDAMKLFYNFASAQWEFMKSEAPESMKHVYFTSYLSYFDTQTAFNNGAFYSAGISLLVCFLCIVVTTRNVIITIFSTLNIAQATLGMYACMILMDWKLNVMESVILSLALGLTIDFVIHFSIAYLLSSQKTREKKVADVLSLVGSPAAMAAITTFLTGLCMMPVTAYCYFQTGVFLMLIMVISITYSMFFFLSLCRFMGPLNNFGQIRCPCKSAKDNESKQSSNSSSRSTKRLTKNGDNHYKFSGKPVYQISRGSLYHTIEDFMRVNQQHPHTHLSSNKYLPHHSTKPSNSNRHNRR